MASDILAAPRLAAEAEKERLAQWRVQARAMLLLESDDNSCEKTDCTSDGVHRRMPTGELSAGFGCAAREG